MLQIQFVGIMVHAFQLLFTDCNYPRAFVWWIGMHAVMFFFLFKEFYNSTYSRIQARKALKLSGSTNGNADQNKCSRQNGYSKQNGASQYYINGNLPTSTHHKTKVQ